MAIMAAGAKVGAGEVVMASLGYLLPLLLLEVVPGLEVVPDLEVVPPLLLPPLLDDDAAVGALTGAFALELVDAVDVGVLLPYEEEPTVDVFALVLDAVFAAEVVFCDIVVELWLAVFDFVLGLNIGVETALLPPFAERLFDRVSVPPLIRFGMYLKTG